MAGIVLSIEITSSSKLLPFQFLGFCVSKNDIEYRRFGVRIEGFIIRQPATLSILSSINNGFAM